MVGVDGAVFMYTQTAGMWSQQQAINTWLCENCMFGRTLALNVAGILAVGAYEYSKFVFVYA